MNASRFLLVAIAFAWALPAAAAEDLEVLVAKTDIPKHAKLDETMVTFERIPAKHVQPGALTRIDDLLGVISAVRIPRGTQLTTTVLASLSEVGLALKIPQGYRSYTFNVDPAGPIGDVFPGNYVDLIALAPASKGKGAVSTTILQNVYVLAVGSDMGSVEISRPGEAPRRPRRDVPATLSVMVTPDEADDLALAIETGRIRVSLRSLWEGNTQIPLQKSQSPLPLRP